MTVPGYANDFALLPQHIWLNVASEGPLPKKANEALQEAIRWKSSPHLLTIPKFQQVPLDLKRSIAQLIHVDPHDVILGNSATYGLHLLAHGIQFNAGDEIMLLQNDFPTDILPWLSLEKDGVRVHQLKAKEYVLTVNELEKVLNPRTRLVCLPLVHSFSGFKQDIKAISHWCRRHGILCVVNLSQAAGAFEVDLSQWQVDAVVCAGYKWLLGPYGTGFCWIDEKLRQQLNYTQNYWISLMDEAGLKSEGVLTLNDDRSARRYDVFGTANFFNFVPWTASIHYLLDIGLDRVEEHNQRLVDMIIEGLDRKRYELLSPHLKEARSNIVVFSLKDAASNANLSDFLKSKGIHLALWKNKLRVSPHIYNSSKEIGVLLGALNDYAAS